MMTFNSDHSGWFDLRFPVRFPACSGRPRRIWRRMGGMGMAAAGMAAVWAAWAWQAGADSAADIEAAWAAWAWKAGAA